ncbi:MAG: hypothetical protein R3B38_00500 [Patescibacteria group bacterium]
MAKKSSLKNSIGFERIAAFIAVAVVVFFIGKYFYEIGTSEAGTRGLDSNYVFISNKGSDENPGSYQSPYRSIRAAFEAAKSIPADNVTIGILDDSYEVTAVDTTGFPWLEGPLTATEANIQLTGMQVSVTPRGEVAFTPQLTTVSLPVFPGIFGFKVENGGLAISNIDFNLTNYPDFDVQTGGELKITNNKFRKEISSASVGTMLSIEAFQNGIMKIGDNDFYFKKYRYNSIPNVALNVNNHSSQNTQIYSNNFYYQFLDQEPNLQFTPSYTPYIGIQAWGNLIDISFNKFTIDTDTYPGNKVPTEESKANVGVMYMYGNHGNFAGNNFTKFYGTPLIIQAPSGSSGQSASVVDNKS